MESAYAQLATRALSIHRSLQTGSSSSAAPPQRTVIALAGPPGSGKSTVAAAVTALINAQMGNPKFCSVLPMDGFHLPRSALDRLPNRAEAYARRGAAWTFDAEGVLDLVTTLHASKQNASKVILAPSFDHVLKDPTLNGIAITPDVSMVILEGNWLLLDEEPWRRISDLVDETWFVDVEPELAKKRVARRHIEAGIEGCWEDAVKRAEGNDLINGELIRQRLVEPAVRVMSVDVTATPAVKEVAVAVEARPMATMTTGILG